ncbi:hypothetical protein [Rufibacter immobilis]|uniref:hypothetical protein n=1 Tax=Rufibacter immobilis TaxID=1348778 RepID=UPI0035E68883
MVVIGPDFTVLTATDAYLRITKRKLDDIVGLHFLLEAFPDKTYSFEENPVRKSIAKVLETKQVDRMELVRYHIALPEEDGDHAFDRFVQGRQDRRGA